MNSYQSKLYHITSTWFFFYNCSDFCLFYRIQTQWYLYTMLALSIYNKCSRRQSCPITPGQSVNLLIQEDMVSLDCEHSWLISGKKILENFDIRTLFLMHKYIYLEKKTALGLNLIFCLNLQKNPPKTVNWCMLLFQFIVSVFKICLPCTGTLTNTWQWSLTFWPTFSSPALRTVRRRKMIGRQFVRMSGHMYSASSTDSHLPILWILHQSRFEEEGEDRQSVRFWSL